VPLRTEGNTKTKLNTSLVVLAVVGIFAAFDLVGHRDTPYFLVKLLAVLAVSAVCILVTRQREALDTFCAVLSALFTLFAVAMTAGDRDHPNLWPFFLGFLVVAVLLVSFTQRKRETLLAIGFIVAFRLMIAAISYAGSAL
jgi:hypothetical protein